MLICWSFNYLFTAPINNKGEMKVRWIFIIVEHYFKFLVINFYFLKGRLGGGDKVKKTHLKKKELKWLKVPRFFVFVLILTYLYILQN